MAAVDLYWIPLGADAHVVRVSGRVYEALAAAAQRRPRRALYHAALIITLGGARHAIEIAPSPRTQGAARGVVATGAVGSRLLRGLRVFRYEVCCRPDGLIPDLAAAVGGPCRVSGDADAARRLLALVREVPTPVWGRDELGAGEMWNSNSMVAWLLASAGLPAGELEPPPGGRAPGWASGVAVAARRPARRLAPAAALEERGEPAR